MFESARGIMTWLGECAKVCSYFSFSVCIIEKWSVQKFDLLSFCVCNVIVNHQSSNAQIISAQNEAVRWTTPLGIPVVQPYRKSTTHFVSFWKSSIIIAVFIALLEINELFQSMKLCFSFWSIYQVKTSLQILSVRRETDKVSYLMLAVLSFFFLLIWLSILIVLRS